MPHWLRTPLLAGQTGMKSSPRLLLITFGLSAIVAGLNMLGWIRFALHRAFEGDFALYYVFSRIGLHEGWSRLYDVAAQRQETDALGPLLWYPAPYTPPLGWFVAPFALLPFPLALTIWSALLFALLLLSWWLAAPGGRLARLTHLTVALALFPVAFALLLGQVVIVVAAAVTLSWWLLRRNQELLAGLALAVLALKPNLALLVPFALLVAGRRRAFLGWALGSVALAALALFTLGEVGNVQWISRLELIAHSLRAYKVVVELTLPGLLGGGGLALASQISIVAFTLFLAWRWRHLAPEMPIVAGLVGSLLTTPFIHPQDLAVLLPASWLYLRTQPSSGQLVPAAAGYLAAELLATPLPLLIVVAGWLGALIFRGSAAYPPSAIRREALTS